MPKAVAQDLKDAGFKTDQFGTPADFDAYLDAVLTDIGREAEYRVGAAVYSAASNTGSTAEKLNFSRIKRAEVCLAEAVLWRRRKKFDDSSATIGSDNATVNVHEQYEKNAKTADEQADYYLSRVTGNSDLSTFATGYVETGPFTEVAP